MRCGESINPLRVVRCGLMCPAAGVALRIFVYLPACRFMEDHSLLQPICKLGQTVIHTKALTRGMFIATKCKRKVFMKVFVLLGFSLNSAAS